MADSLRRIAAVVPSLRINDFADGSVLNEFNSSLEMTTRSLLDSHLHHAVVLPRGRPYCAGITTREEA